MRQTRLAVSLLAVMIMTWLAVPASAQYTCGTGDFTIVLSPPPNPIGTFPNGNPAQNPWYSMSPGQSQTITIDYDPCTTSFFPSATQMRYSLQMGGGVVGTTQTVPRTSQDSFAPASMTITVPNAEFLRNSNVGGRIVAEALNSSNVQVTSRSFEMDIFVPGAATFVPELNPSQVTITAGEPNGATFQAAINHDPGFNATVRVYPNTLPPGITVTPAEQFLNPPYNAVSFTVRAASSVSPGSPDLPITFNAGTTFKTAMLRANVLANPTPPDFSVAINPDRFSVAQGQTQTINVVVTSLNGFQGAVMVTSNANPARLDVVPLTITVPANGTGTGALNVRALATATTGSADFTLSAISGTIQKSIAVTPTITATTQPDFAFSASGANPPQILAGESTRVTVMLLSGGGFSAPVNVVAQLPAGVSVSAADRSFTLSGVTPSRQITLLTDVSAAGVRTVTFTATSGSLSRTAAVTFTITPRASGTGPIIDAVSPELTTPTPSQIVYLTGKNFVTGATALSLTPGVVVERTLVRTPVLAEVAITVRPGVSPGGYRLDLRNPDGASSANGGRLIIRHRDDLGGPLGVTAAVILEPRQGQIIANGQTVYPIGHLATSGTGTVHGYWALDGVPFDQFSATVAGGRLVTAVGKCPQSEGAAPQVCAQVPIPPLTWGPSHRLELIIDQPAKAVSPSVTLAGSPDSASRMTVYEPVDGAELTTGSPLFRWTLVPGASGYELEFEEVTQAGHGRTILFRTVETRLTLTRQDILRLGVGTYRWRVRAISGLGDRFDSTPPMTITLRSTLMSMRVAQVASAGNLTGLGINPSTPATASLAVAAPVHDYAASPNLTISQGGGSGSKSSGRGQLSTQGEIASTSSRSQFTGDLTYAASPDPQRLVQESRNWVIMAGTPVERTGGDVRFGYTAPDFTDGTEYLTSGLARTGILTRARSRFGVLSYYQPVETTLHGVMSGDPENLNIRSFGLATPEGRGYLLRLIALEVTERANTTIGISGSRLRTFGFYGKYDIRSWLAVTGEAARGHVTPFSNGAPGRDGLALRFGVTGTISGAAFGIALRSVDANFVNPANRGLTPGGVSDRLAADFTLAKTLGRTALSLTLTRQLQGRSSESTLPNASQTTAQLNLSTSLGNVFMNLGANTTADRGDGDSSTLLPGTQRRSSGVSAAFTETVRGLTFSQNFSVQRSSDAIHPLSSQNLGSANFGVSGQFLPRVTLSSSLSASRTKADAALGITDNWTLSLQPALALPLALSFQPVISYSRTNNGTMRLATKGDGYQGILQWSPTFLGNIVAAQVSGSWNRNGFGGLTPGTKLTRSYLGSLTMRLNKKRGMPMFQASPLPGVTAPQTTLASPASNTARSGG